jgi:hypothetical protein
MYNINIEKNNMLSAIENSAIIVLMISLITACSSINKTDNDKVIAHQKKYENSTGDCDSTYSNNCAQIKIEFPQVEYSQNQAVENRINNLIQGYFLQSIFDETPAQSIDDLIRNFLQEYESFKNDFPEAFQHWRLEKTGKVRHNSNYIFSIELSEYSYLGGAHPNTYVNFVNYDLKSGEEIKLDDLLVNNFGEDLNRIAELEFRKLKELSESEDLGQAGFWFGNNRFHLNDNFLITDSSLIFYYNNYEITAYAFGPTELEISCLKIKDIINSDGLLGAYPN